MIFVNNFNHHANLGLKSSKYVVIIKIGYFKSLRARMDKDYLRIENGTEDIKLDISFGYIDRISGAFNFQSNAVQNITGYKLSLDIENTDVQTLKNLEHIMLKENKFLNTIISLDGIISKGKAKIAKIFSFDGISYDVELIN